MLHLDRKLPVGQFNSLAPEGFDYSLKLVNFKLISTINILSIFCEIAIRWMPQHLIDHKSTLVQVMAWCHQATSHYLSQCWHRSMPSYGITGPQWVNIEMLSQQYRYSHYKDETLVRLFYLYTSYTGKTASFYLYLYLYWLPKHNYCKDHQSTNWLL